MKKPNNVLEIKTVLQMMQIVFFYVATLGSDAKTIRIQNRIRILPRLLPRHFVVNLTAFGEQ